MKFKKKKPKKDQLYFIWFDSGYRSYFSFGKDLEVMANNLLQKYNSYCTKEWKINSLEDMLDEWKFLTYIVDINSASDDDCRTFENEIYLGDYLDYVRERSVENGKI